MQPRKNIPDLRRSRHIEAQLAPQPIVWALDAYPSEEHDEMHFTMAQALRDIFPHSPIHPVYVLSEESFVENFSLRAVVSDEADGLKPMALEALKALLSRMPPLHLQRPRVLVESSASRALGARKLMSYAERVGAHMISLSAHPRRGLSRFLSGSFSDSILDHSGIPVFVTGPKTSRERQQIKTIVLPTDFSGLTTEAFEEVVLMARRLDAELHLFHKAVHVVDPVFQSGVQILGGGWVSLETYMNQPSEDRAREAKKWIQRAEALRVQARFVANDIFETTAETILKYVNDLGNESTLIAMTSHSNAIAGQWLGRVTRDVISRSPCPVYLMGREMR